MTPEAQAKELDQADPLQSFRHRFHLPVRRDGTPWIYFVGNSLGAMPREARQVVTQELDDWARLGVEGHFHGQSPWFPYHEQFRESGARLVGGVPGEVVMMNSLTVNLHLMLASFYQPAPGRSIIVTEDCAFPSDTYALESHIRHRGYDPAASLLVLSPRPGEALLRTEDIVELLERRGSEIALVLMSGVNYYTGQLFDLAAIAGAARRQGCAVGFDLAHAAGNVELALHDWGVDFAVWCSYKYLNAGPGAVAGCFVHERHGKNRELPRLAGWWGNDPASRFLMHLNQHFVPQRGAEGWQLSNPPILSLAPLTASLALFAEAGMTNLRRKSLALTGYLERRIVEMLGDRIEIISPRDPTARGCQLSLRVRDGTRKIFDAIQEAGALCDYRHPDVIRVAPVPLYNTFHEAWRFAEVLKQAMDQS